MRKILSILMIFVIAITVVLSPIPKAMGYDSASVNAAPAVWSGKVDTSWYTGDKDSYDIYTAEQLAGLAELADKAAHEDRFNGVTINLMSDIVLNDTSNYKNWDKKPPKNVWNPIGHTGSAIMGYNPFAGVFNGNGHTITGMYCKENSYGFWGTTSSIGLFECICGACVTDLKIDKSYLCGSGNTGTLVGVSESSFISGVQVTNSRIDAMDGKSGGIVGSCHQFVNTYLISILFLAGIGIVINPLLYADDFAEEVFGEHGTIISECTVDNLSIQKVKSYGSESIGGVAGGGRLGVYKAVVSNFNVKNGENVTGIVAGANPENNNDVAYRDCSYYSCSISKPVNANAKTFADKKFVKNLKMESHIKVGAKKSALHIKRKKKKAVKINLKCITNSNMPMEYSISKTPKKGSKYCKVSPGGIVTLKKKAPKGTYKIKVTVKENDTFTAAAKTISIKLR